MANVYDSRGNAIGTLISTEDGTAFPSLNFGVDGDSITSGNQWSYHMADYLNAATHHNVAYGGGRWAKQAVTYNETTYTPQNYNDANFAGFGTGVVASLTDATSAQKIANNCAPIHLQKFKKEVDDGTYPAPDVFFFALGTNDEIPTDEQVEAALACTDYPTDEMQYNMAGAMRYCLQFIHENYPSCKIYVLLPIQRAWQKYHESQWETKSKPLMQKRCEIIRKIAEDFSVEVIDMYSKSGIIGALEPASGEGEYLLDGLHPNADGRVLMGKCAAAHVKSTYFY